MKAVLCAVAGWLMVLAAGIFLLGTIADEHHLRYAVIMVLFAAAALWFFKQSKGQKKKPAPADPAAEQAARRAQAQAEWDALPQEEKAAQLRQMAAAMVPKSADERTGAYDLEYTQVGVYRPEDVSGAMPEVGTYLEPEEEPDNPYDSEAVVLRDAAGEAVGYLNKGKLREAVRRGIHEGVPMVVQVSHAGDRLKVYIGIDKLDG